VTKPRQLPRHLTVFRDYAEAETLRQIGCSRESPEMGDAPPSALCMPCAGHWMGSEGPKLTDPLVRLAGVEVYRTIIVELHILGEGAAPRRPSAVRLTSFVFCFSI
jgi:hypothetical protein